MTKPSIATATLLMLVLMLAFSVAGSAANHRAPAASRTARPADGAPGAWWERAQSLWNVVLRSVTTDTSLSTLPKATTSTGSCIDPDGRLIIPCVHST